MKLLKANPYYAAGIAAFVIWGFIPFPLKALAEYPSGQILYFRVALSVSMLLVISLFFRRDTIRETYKQVTEGATKEKRQFILYTLLGGMLLTINWLTFIGNVCMDMCMVDVTGLNVKAGDEAIVFGPKLTLTDMATRIGTIPYELLTNVSSRVKRIFFSE